jgi:NitT/TauT family transport system substrate-binding protein
LAGALLSLSIVGLAGSAGGTASPKVVGDRAPANTAVTIGVSNPNAAQFLPYLVQAAGFFAKENISATVVTLAPAVWIADLAAGAIQFGVGSPTAVETSVLNNFTPIQWMATWTINSQIEIIGAPGITSMAGLAGKNVGLSAPGSTSNTLVTYLMNQAGLSPSQYNGVDETSSAALNAAFIGGKVSSAITAPPLDQVLLADVPGSTILHNFALDKSFLWPQAEIAGNTNWANSHQQATIAVLGAMQLGLKYWNTHAAAAEAVVNTNIIGLTSAQVNASWTASQQVFLKSLEATPLAAENNVITLMNGAGYPTALANATRLRAIINTKYIALALAGLQAKKTIICVKGTLTKRITAVNPKCPAGYHLK